jgi:hypothetical protein
VKKFLPGETRTWKVFLLDIWKQLASSFFAHFLNVFLSIYLKQVTNAGNGCVWYLVNYFLDLTVGMLIAYILFKIVDTLAIVFEIEVSLYRFCEEEIDFVLGPEERNLYQ